MAERSGFCLYHEDIDALRPLTKDQKGTLLEALFDFSANGVILQTSDSAVQVAFSMMASKISRDSKKYEKRCEKNRENIKKRYERIPPYTTENDRIQTLPTVTVPVTGTATETETVKNNVVVFNRGSPPPFEPPALEDVQDFCYKRGSSVDPFRFYSYYASRGWVMGKTPMTDWQAAIQWWEQRDEAESRRAPTEIDEPVHWID